MSFNLVRLRRKNKPNTKYCQTQLFIFTILYKKFLSKFTYFFLKNGGTLCAHARGKEDFHTTWIKVVWNCRRTFVLRPQSIRTDAEKKRPLQLKHTMRHFGKNGSELEGKNNDNKTKK